MNPLFLTRLGLGAALLLNAAGASAQSIYLDIGSAQVGAPSPAYGAAAGTPGHWNLVDSLISPGPFPLVDTSGTPTAATVTLPSGGALYYFGVPCLQGDDDLLLRDLQDPLSGGDYIIDGLSDGPYTVITYAYDPGVPTFETEVRVVGATELPQDVGDTTFWCSLMAHGYLVTYALHTVDVVGGRLEVQCRQGDEPFGACNGIQILQGQGLVNPGTSYCTAAPNSTGTVGALSARGLGTAAGNYLTLLASDLPGGGFGIFIASRLQAFLPGAGGTSNGNLCLGGQIDRFARPGEILATGSSGGFELALDLGNFPNGSSSIAVLRGDTWNFQAWHRDPGGLGSNYTAGLSINFE